MIVRVISRKKRVTYRYFLKKVIHYHYSLSILKSNALPLSLLKKITIRYFFVTFCYDAKVSY